MTSEVHMLRSCVTHRGRRVAVSSVSRRTPSRSMSNLAPDPVFVLRGAKSPVTSLAFLHASEAGKLRKIAAGTQDGHIMIWDLKTKCVIKEWSSNSSSSVLWLQSPSEEELWAHVRYDSVAVWDISLSVPQVKVQYPVSEYLGFSQSHLVSLDNCTSLLAIPGPNQEGVSVWNVNTKTKISCLMPLDARSRGSLMQVRWVKVGTSVSLLVAYESGHLSLWNWNTSSVVTEAQVTDNPICLTFDDKSQIGIIGTASEKVFIFSISSELTIAIIKEFCITNAGLSSCVIRPDGKLFVTGGWDSCIRIFSRQKYKPLAVLKYHKKTVECVAYSASEVEFFGPGFLLAAGSSDKSISLWNIFNV
ncbi:guanine nucleotide-binding protein subunit beta-like protein 1 isoform X2 [Procambarus clarkii]|uniref:guanine nucleotide-binding protein subunit beta-like protein 1 isoform X2 n=1 Tax=Procambarus clarkii TaxID=6728 RepID=UPI001E6713BB|nr:guanine nucleotide-binding protein subunit beta-like protein 1 isoform X2 [Procambarus clarkii]